MPKNSHYWQCIHYSNIFKDGGATRIKQYLTYGYSDVSKCPKVFVESCKVIRENLKSFRIEKQCIIDEHVEFNGCNGPHII